MSAYTITQGTDLPLEISNVVDEYGAAVSDWAGWDLDFRVSATEDGTAILAKSTADADWLAGPPAVIRFRLTAAETAGLSSTSYYYYQAFLRSPGGIRQLFESGTIEVLPAID